MSTTDYSPPGNYVAYIRDVVLLPDEKVTHVFSPEGGLMAEPPKEGQLLIVTNQRIISFSKDRGRHETFLVPIEELKGISVKSGPDGTMSLLQGLLLAVGGVVAYFILAYWLTGRLRGPSVPLINIDLGPLLIMVAIFWGAVLVARYYFAKEDNLVTFQGSNWVFGFPYRGNKAEEDIYEVVNTLFTARRSRNGHVPFLWDE